MVWGDGGEIFGRGFGPLEEVDPQFTALLYAGDRFEAKKQLVEALEAGKIVLADRYVGSNLAHQAARVAAAARAEFVKWIEHLEYGIYGLPRESAVIYLRVPPAEAQKLVGLKEYAGIYGGDTRFAGRKFAASGRCCGHVR